MKTSLVASVNVRQRVASGKGQQPRHECCALLTKARSNSTLFSPVSDLSPRPVSLSTCKQFPIDLNTRVHAPWRNAIGRLASLRARYPFEIRASSVQLGLHVSIPWIVPEDATTKITGCHVAAGESSCSRSCLSTVPGIEPCEQARRCASRPRVLRATLLRTISS